MRTRVEVLRFFDDLKLIPPGVVNVSSWRASPLAGKSAPDNTLRRKSAGNCQKNR
jgi:hypothetical protein